MARKSVRPPGDRGERGSRACRRPLRRGSAIGTAGNGASRRARPSSVRRGRREPGSATTPRVPVERRREGAARLPGSAGAEGNRTSRVAGEVEQPRRPRHRAVEAPDDHATRRSGREPPSPGPKATLLPRLPGRERAHPLEPKARRDGRGERGRTPLSRHHARPRESSVGAERDAEHVGRFMRACDERTADRPQDDRTADGAATASSTDRPPLPRRAPEPRQAAAAQCSRCTASSSASCAVPSWGTGGTQRARAGSRRRDGPREGRYALRRRAPALHSRAEPAPHSLSARARTRATRRCEERHEAITASVRNVRARRRSAFSRSLRLLFLQLQAVLAPPPRAARARAAPAAGRTATASRGRPPRARRGRSRSGADQVGLPVHRRRGESDPLARQLLEYRPNFGRPVNDARSAARAQSLSRTA